MTCGVHPVSDLVVVAREYDRKETQTVMSRTADSLIALQEYERRFDIWLDNLRFIDSYNSEDKTHWVRICYCFSICGTLHL